MNMAHPPIEEDEKPLDPAVERVRRKLLRFVVINLGILFVALMAVVLAVVYKSRNPEPVAVAEPAFPETGEVVEAEIPLPAGARIVSQSLSGNRVSIEAVLEEGGQVFLLYDFAERRLIGRYTVSPE